MILLLLIFLTIFFLILFLLSITINKSNPNSSKTDETSTSNSNSKPLSLLDIILLRTGIKIKFQENFENDTIVDDSNSLVKPEVTFNLANNITLPQTLQEDTVIVFDSNDKIKQNYELYLKTYFSLINIENINKRLKDDTGKTIQEIINLNNSIDTQEYVTLIKQIDGLFNYSILVYNMEDSTHFINLGLNILLQMKNSGCYYYLPNENIYYETNNKDLIIYGRACLDDIQLRTAVDNLKDTEAMDGYNITSEMDLYKISMRRMLNKNFSNIPTTQSSNMETIISQFENSIVDFFKQMYHSSIITTTPIETTTPIQTTTQL